MRSGPEIARGWFLRINGAHPRYRGQMLALVLESMLDVLALGPVLEVPWACGETYSCTQGNGGQASHMGHARYAWDFGMPLGTEIVAAHGGRVLSIEMGSRVGGCSHVYANDANYVLIDHQDGSAGLYLHVEGDSSDLEVGDPVAAGDVIARVGQTGWSCGPHLHFQVQEICGSWWCQSVPAEFHGVGAIANSEQIPSKNCGAPAATIEGGGGETIRAETSWGEPGFDPRDEAHWALALLVLAGLASRRRR
jgi:MYXO-CTERM domain-containing protein